MASGGGAPRAAEAELDGDLRLLGCAGLLACALAGWDWTGALLLAFAGTGCAAGRGDSLGDCLAFWGAAAGLALR